MPVKKTSEIYTVLYINRTFILQFNVHGNLMYNSLRSWRYCVGARLKFWRRSRVPKQGSRDEAVEIHISRGFATRDGSAVKSHATILQRLRHQISLNYYTIPPATQAKCIKSHVSCKIYPYISTV